MKRGFLIRMVFAVIAAASLLLAGCAYTTVTAKTEIPKPGPRVATGQAAVMPQVKDNRSWPHAAQDDPINHIRIFAPQITSDLRKSLVERGLFKALPTPEAPSAKGMNSSLKITISLFKLAKAGLNSWIVPHLLVDGLALPVFAATTVVSGGDVDLGGYFIPSTKMGVTVQATAYYAESGQNILVRSYLVELPVGAVSERELRRGGVDKYGAKVGEREGAKALAILAETMARDPNWASLAEYRVLTDGELEQKAAKKRSDLVAAGQKVLPLFKPLAYSPEVAKVLRDGVISPGIRADIINDLRARSLGLSDPDQLPADQKMTAEKAKELFDEPAVAQSQVKAALAARALNVAVAAINPPEPPAEEKAAKESKAAKAAKATKPKPVPESPRDAALRSGFSRQLARVFKGKPHLQELLLARADRAVKEQWPPMERLLKEVDSPQTRRYLQTRTR